MGEGENLTEELAPESQDQAEETPAPVYDGEYLVMTHEMPYEARPQFEAFHDRTQRFAIIVAHRRAGKTVACINDLIKAALDSTLPEPRFAYLAPYYAQAKDVAWSYLKRFLEPVPGVQFNESELRADLPNEGRIRLYGADNYDRMRGIYLDGVILDEFADMDPRAWTEVIRPALADRKGWAVFIGTPKGQNSFFDTWQRALADPDWFTLMLKASETGLIDVAELAAAAKEMTPDQYAQEFECSFHAAVIGAFYAKEINAAEDEKRITSVPWEPSIRVHTAWDLGVGDSTAIWFAQQVGKEVRLIDYYESSGVGLDHYVKVLLGKRYVYGDHILPHDAEVREFGTGKTRVEMMRSLGLEPRVIPAQSIDDGINAVRMLLPRCWFDAEKTAPGVKALREYRAEWDEKHKVLKNRPLHNWASHPSDAFRYLAQGLREDTKKNWGQPSATWVT